MRDGQSQVREQSDLARRSLGRRSNHPEGASECPELAPFLRNLLFLGRKAVWRGCCARSRPASCANEHLGRPYRLRACLPTRCRGYRFKEGRWPVSIWPVSRLDQSPQSRQHRGGAGAQRKLESASLRQCAPTMTRQAITPRSNNCVDLKGCAARLQQVGPTSA
jgi:hypothetical protein